MSQEPRSAMLKLNRSVNFTPGPAGEACCVPSQIQPPTNHLSNESCSGSFCASAALAGLSWANADRARSAKARMSIFFILSMYPPRRWAMSIGNDRTLVPTHDHRLLDARQIDGVDACR